MPSAKKPSKRRMRKTKGYERVFILLCTCFLGIFPFITRLSVRKVPQIEAEYFATFDGYAVDLMLYCKEVALLVFCGAVLLYFLGSRIFPDNVDKIDTGRLKSLKLPLICIGGYIFFSVLSFALSPYKATALWGVNSEYEGLIAVLCYCGLFLFSLFYLKKDRKKQYDTLVIVKRGVIILSLAAGCLALVEIFYRPILEIGFMKYLISPAEYREELAGSIRNENFIGQISLMFNNPGFLGGFCALFIPLGYCIIRTERGIWRAIGIAGTSLLGLALFWSRSDVAMISLIITIPLSFFLLIREGKKAGVGENTRKKNINTVLVNSALIVLLTALLIVLSQVMPAYSSRVRARNAADPSLVSESTAEEMTGGAAKDDVDAAAAEVPENTAKEAPQKPVMATPESAGRASEPTDAEESENTAGSAAFYRLDKAELTDGVLYLYSGSRILSIAMDMEVFDRLYEDYDENDFSACLVFSDGERILPGRHKVILKATSIREEQEGFALDDERFSMIGICVDRELIIMDFGYPGTVEFYMTPEGIKLFGQGSTLLEKIPQPRVKGLESFYPFATGRGYIWAQSLPLLKSSLLWGSGNGTFAFGFRQNEIVGLLNTHGSCKYVIDRPHNWYLQIACSSGVTALLCVLALFVIYIIMFVKNMIRGGSINSVHIGLFAGLTGFMLCGFINDSCITVNPLFWAAFGCAVGLETDEFYYFSHK